MKRAIFGLVASALVSSLMLGKQADAAEKVRRVVVEQMPGKGADKLRQMVSSTLDQKGYEVVADKKVASAEAELGLLQMSDNYPAVAKELKAIAFVSGAIIGTKKLTARLRVKNAEGEALGEASWTGATLPKLMARVNEGLATQLAGILSSAKGKDDGAGDKAVADKPVAKAKKEKVAEEAPAAAESTAAKASGDDQKSDDAAPKKRKREKVAVEKAPEHAAESDSHGDSTTVAATAPEREAPAGGVNRLDIAVGAHVYSRKLTYNENFLGGQQEYRLPAVPAPNLSLDYYVLPYLGLSVGGEYSLALISQDPGGNRYRTSSFGYSVGAKGRHTFGERSEITAELAYAGNKFTVTPESGDPTPPQVAGVDYKQLKIGAGLRLAMGEKLAFIAGADYLHLLSMGEIQSDKYFPYSTGHGGQGFAGVAMRLPWMAGTEGRLTADLRRYVLDMHSEQTDKRIAGGATDQYIGMNLSFGYRN